MSERPYHHGNLRQALVEAGVSAARRSGPGALTLRELAKAVGVSPAAAYRHFDHLDHLVAAVSQRAREWLAVAMIAARDRTVSDGTAASAWARLFATGDAYVRFAIAEPHLFEAAFTPCRASPGRPDHPSAWDVLQDALDELERQGLLAAGRRPTAPFVAWSAVHGLASIAVSGSLPVPLAVDETVDAVLGGVRRALEA